MVADIKYYYVLLGIKIALPRFLMLIICYFHQVRRLCDSRVFVCLALAKELEEL